MVASIFAHVVLGAREGKPYLRDEETRAFLAYYLERACKQLEVRPIAISVAQDHAHVLAALPISVAVSEWTHLMQAASGAQIHHLDGDFAWDSHALVFSVGSAELDSEREYVEA